MTEETDILIEEEHGHDDAWSGAKEPFKASYGKLMMWYFLVTDAFTFAGFLIAYGALRFSSPTWPVPDFVFSTAPFGIHGMPLIFVTIMSFLLIISSVTMVRAVQEGHRENKRGVIFWMLMTIIGGAGFLGCQAWEWNNLISTEKMTVTRNPFGTHVEDGVYLGLTGEPSDAEGDTFEAGESYLIHQAGHGGHHSEEGHEMTADEAFVEGANGEIDAAGIDMAAIPEDGVDFPGFTLDAGGFIHRKFVTGEGPDQAPGQQSFGPKAFGALFFWVTGFHGFHVFSGVVFLTIIMINVAGGVYVARKNGYEMVEKIGLYWHFVDLVWVFVFLVFYLL